MRIYIRADVSDATDSFIEIAVILLNKKISVSP